MAELNDKLITYGNLSTFYDKLQEQGLGGNAIEDASVLPDASENKNKLFRLESDDNVYVSELKSRTSTTTNRLPDAQQIDKAYIIQNGNMNYYKGEYKIICADGEISGFGWLFYSPQEWALVLTKDNADNTSENTLATIVYFDDEGEPIVNQIDNTITTSASTDYYGYDKLVDMEAKVIPATYNAPESAQIGNAYITDSVQVKQFVYDGTYTTITINGTTYNGYKWILTNSGYILLSSKKASDFYYYREFDEGDSAWHTSTDVTLYLIDTTVGEETAEKTWIGSDIYIPQLNAPDSEQVDNAFIELDVDSNKYYFGITTFHCTDGDLNMPSWGVDDYKYFTTISPNNIYSEEIGMVNEDYFSDGLDVDWEDMSINMSLSAAESIINSFNFNTVPVSTVKYQRTEVTEEWDWQPLTDNATNEDIDAMFESSSPVVKRVLMKLGSYNYNFLGSYINEDDEKNPSSERYPLSILEGLVNENDETMEYDGNTYYKWVKYEEQGDGTSIPDEVGDENVIVLTTSLNLTLPFTSESPEWAYMIGSESEEAVYASPNNETYPKEALIHEDGSITYEE